MNTKIKTGSTVEPQSGRKVPLRSSLFLSLATLVVIGMAGIWGHARIEKEIKANLTEQLNISLKSTVENIRAWRRERITSIEVSAVNLQVRQHILHLAHSVRRNKKTDPKQLRASPDHIWLRQNLSVVTQKHGFTGFVVFDPTGLEIAALLDEPVGQRDLMVRSDFVQRALNGQSVISVPFESEIPLSDANGRRREVWPTMFVASPVFEDNGQVGAVLAFRLRSETEFTDLMKTSRTGSSGETYAFNSKGQMITQSRFELHLKSIGLLPDTPDSFSILNVEIRDPGGNMVTGFVSPIPRDQQPWTRMAQSALQYESGWDVEGYNDYRGVPVVGAWTWLDDLSFGITHEIDVAEALNPLHTISRIFLLLYGLLVAAAVFGLIQYHRKQQTEEAIIQEQKQSEELSRRMQSIFQNTIDGIIIMDDKGTIESFNPAAEAIFGYARNEVIGRNIKMLMPEPYQSEHDGYLGNYAMTGETHILGQLRELVGLRKDGSTFLIELAANALLLESGKKFTGIIRDITERKRIELEITQAKEEAEKASEAKTQFLSQMSHELRTPMNAILGFAQILEGEPDSKDHAVQKECVNHILKAGHHLMELINDVLNLSRIDTGNIVVSPEPVALVPLIREVLEINQPLTAENKVTLIDQITGNADPVVRADRSGLHQVLMNLISNAIKYNREQGTVTLSCKPVEENRLRIAVADTGPGISAKDQKTLFLPFNRLQNNVNTIAGTGIGLTIAKMLAELMDGAIRLESEVGKGCTFTFELPLSTESQTDSTEEEAVNAPVPNTDPCVLYVEDNPANMLLVQQILIKHWPEVELLTATRGDTGMDMAKALKPSLILLDVKLPGMSGLEVFARLKQLPETRNIPVVAISANALDSDIKKAMDMGFDAYLTKPLVLKTFLQTLHRYLGAPKTRLVQRK